MWHSYVALGDSFTEGLADELSADGRHRGWSDRLALTLSERVPNFRYANLAIRGKTLPEIRREQVPVAVSMRPALVSVAGGVNDAMRRSFDLNRNATALEESVRLLRSTGSEVLLFAFGDPGRRSRVLGVLRERLWQLNSATRAIAQAYDCFLVDFWGVATFDDDALWDEDRLHLAPAGHELVAASVQEVLGLGDDSWRTPAPMAIETVTRRTRSHAQWAGRHGLPWLGRRLRGTSSGIGITPKRPTLREYPESADELN